MSDRPFVFLAVRLDPAVKRRFKAEAAYRGVTLQDAVDEAIHDWLEQGTSRVNTCTSCGSRPENLTPNGA
jgi:hypothetical protein